MWNFISFVKFTIFISNWIIYWFESEWIFINWIIYWIESQQYFSYWIIFWIEYSWSNFELSIELNQFWTKFKYWIESIWVSDRATSTSEQVREATRPTPEFSGAKEKLGVAQVKLTPDVTDSLKQTSTNQCPHQGLYVSLEENKVL